MENMNNIPETNEQLYPKKGLDKKGVVILIISLVLSVVFFTIGFISLSGKKLELYETITDSVEEYEYVEYKFTPESSGYYAVYVDGARVTGCEDEDGDYITYTRISNFTASLNYDYACYFYLSIDITYTIEFYTQDDEISILLERYYDY